MDPCPGDTDKSSEVVDDAENEELVEEYICPEQHVNLYSSKYQFHEMQHYYLSGKTNDIATFVSYFILSKMYRMHEYDTLICFFFY